MAERGPFIDNERLREIRAATDWRRLFAVLGLTKDPRSKLDDWWARSPLSSEEHASFHMGERGWYCFSTQQGGGPIELVQAVLKQRTGETLSCYQAGAWLLQNGVSSLPEVPSSGSGTSSSSPTAIADAGGGTESTEERGEEKESGQARGDETGSVGDGATNPGGTGEAVVAAAAAGEVAIPGKATVNRPIRQNLLPLLTQLGEHPEFVRRGISRETCEYLGAGYLDKGRSSLKGRLVFQVRGVRPEGDTLRRVVLSHVGRATTPEQEERDGKWRFYGGFQKALELYNLDNLLLDPAALEQVRESGEVLLVEGCFDVAKLVEAGLRNAVATFGAHLSPGQVDRFRLIAERLGAPKILVWYDRDEAGRNGQAQALEALRAAGLEATGFDWERVFSSPRRPTIKIPEAFQDVCDLSVEQIRWLFSVNRSRSVTTRI